MNLKVRLAVMNFLEFAVWGAYLTSMGNYLGKAGMGAEIAWFYAIQGIVSIFMPTLIGIVADKWVQPQRLLGFCHLFRARDMEKSASREEMMAEYTKARDYLRNALKGYLRYRNTADEKARIAQIQHMLKGMR